jgi:hypothetical protein
VPGNSPNGVEGIRMIRVSTLSEALAAAGIAGDDEPPRGERVRAQ